jgi:hypothetical protein
LIKLTAKASGLILPMSCLQMERMNWCGAQKMRMSASATCDVQEVHDSGGCFTQLQITDELIGGTEDNDVCICHLQCSQVSE